METEKIQVVFTEDVKNVELTIREGQAPEILEHKAPVKTKISGVLNSPFEYLNKRIDKGQFTQERSYLEVDRENITLTLVINEDDEYLRGTIKGKLEPHPKFVEFGINTGKKWTPVELGMFFKMNRSFFNDLQENMKLVTELMNFTAQVNNKIERSVKENGDRTENFVQVVNSNLPSSFKLYIPIFKGISPEFLDVETFAIIDGREVTFTLLSPGANQTLESLRNNAIDTELSAISMLAPDIAIIEI